MMSDGLADALALGGFIPLDISVQHAERTMKTSLALCLSLALLLAACSIDNETSEANGGDETGVVHAETDSRDDEAKGGRDLAADFIAELLAPAKRAINEAVVRGDLEVADIESAVIELAGPLLTRHIILGETVPQADGAAAVQRFIDSYQTP